MESMLPGPQNLQVASLWTDSGLPGGRREAAAAFQGHLANEKTRGWTPLFFSPPDTKGLLDFMLESAFELLHHAPPIPPEQLASGSRRVSRQSSSPVDPADGSRFKYPTGAARQWIPPSIPLSMPEWLVRGSRRVSRQSGLPVDPAEYPARAAGQWIPPSIPPELLASGLTRPRSREHWEGSPRGQPPRPNDPDEWLCPAPSACSSGFEAWS